MSFNAKNLSSDKKLQAYIIGIALGDGNLSNPNKRAVRLRISCDMHYPILIEHIVNSLKLLFPKNRVGLVRRKSHCIDISVYSNFLPELLEWNWNDGPKDKQNVKVPIWVKTKSKFIRECLRGLLQTDGCIYEDRGYAMINFVNTCPNLANNVFEMITFLGYKPNMQKLKQFNGKIRHTIRLSRDVPKFIKEIDYWKK